MTTAVLEQSDALAADRDIPTPGAKERARLVRAAEEVLLDGGFCELGVRAVCERAQLSTRRFYAHFRGKADLLAVLLGTAVGDAVETLHSAVQEEIRAEERLWAYVYALTELLLGARPHTSAHLIASHWRRLMPCYPDLFRRAIEELTAPLVSVLEDGYRTGVFSSRHPQVDARSIFFLMTGLIFDRPWPFVGNRRAEVESVIVPFIARAVGCSRLPRRGGIAPFRECQQGLVEDWHGEAVG